MRPIHDYDGQCADCMSLRAEFDAYKDADRTAALEFQQLYFSALSDVDELTAQLENAQDARHKRLAEQRLALMANIAPHLASVTPGHGPERDALLVLLAHVAEFAEKPAHVQAMRAAYGEWEARRAK